MLDNITKIKFLSKVVIQSRISKQGESLINYNRGIGQNVVILHP